MTTLDAIAMAHLIVQFGQVLRVTEDSQGRRESDTTHSLMLALIAGEMADKEQLDRGVVVGMCLVHDIAEVYAGDTSTLYRLSAEDAEAKRQREDDALRRVREELRGFPWVLGVIERYEAQECRESMFVKYLDKAMPRLLHQANGCAVPKKFGMTLETFKQRIEEQNEVLPEKYPGFDSLRELLIESGERSVESW